MKKYCECCCRQIIIGDRFGSDITAPGPITMLVAGKFCCGDCSKDLDEYGLFPEEYKDNVSLHVKKEKEHEKKMISASGPANLVSSSVMSREEAMP